MERLDNDLLTLQFLREEHQHRYQYAARFAKGVVADCACGIGYSASLLLANPAVTQYYGFDVDEESIRLAGRKKIARATFSCGSILSLPCSENSVDTFISLETLEHLSDPQLALDEVRRVLKPEGVFICSVPTKKYENYCSDLYGPNPYHLQTFDYEDFERLLKSKFTCVTIAVIAQEIVSVVHKPGEIATHAEVVTPAYKETQNGSFIALCSEKEEIRHQSVIYTGLSRIAYDEEMLIPLKQSLAAAEAMAVERWHSLVESAKKNEEITCYKEQAERISAERLEAFTRTENLLKERDKNLADAQALIEQLQQQIKELSNRNADNKTPYGNEQK